ncbi:segregation and condensation protein A [Coxiella burnetii]|uniref:segregation and condensation protein A n=1 Tax=Coxiella burnetii TaxID=777 RepID=UPI000183CFAC|nr:ScpA family protein [Coxiella burnetii]ACJ20029.1 segregation and condensation protein [Coxiella burnetii CbuK_Q154]AIT63058.1 Segregation and condensation protein A [Coxiella burnetii str. Namibia]PHH56806.1 segregation/condensation protein A [Coxiella burnetii]UYK68875.1 segregation/condensation protein A [Coxiella burnetii]
MLTSILGRPMENQEVVNQLAGFEVKVSGQPLSKLPEDLYIPPDALRVFLEAFEGPLDLLLYLIKKHNIDILDIPIAEITRQYMQFVDLMREMRIELAAEYLVMAAMLAEIKSRLLLPRPVVEEENEQDPRAELVRRLQEYERYKKAAYDLDQLPRVGRDTFIADAAVPPMNIAKIHPTVELPELLNALKDVLQRASLYNAHSIAREPLSIRERMSRILSLVDKENFIAFTRLFTVEEGRMGVVVTLIATLELIRQSVIELVQAEPFALIHIRAKG